MLFSQELDLSSRNQISADIHALLVPIIGVEFDQEKCLQLSTIKIKSKEDISEIIKSWIPPERRAEAVKSPHFEITSNNLFEILRMVRPTLLVQNFDINKLEIKESHFYNYGEEFLSAYKRTLEFGFELPDFSPTDKRFIDARALSLMRYYLDNNCTWTNIFGLAGGGLYASSELLQASEQIFGCKGYLTMGYLTQGEGETRRVLMPFPPSLAKQYLVEGDSELRTKVAFHAWITLESLEIVDVTFLASYGAANDIKSLERTVFCSNPNLIPYTEPPHPSLNQLAYHPTVLGTDYLEAIGVPTTYNE